jgi:hypothetical protein
VFPETKNSNTKNDIAFFFFNNKTRNKNTTRTTKLMTSDSLIFLTKQSKESYAITKFNQPIEAKSIFIQSKFIQLQTKDTYRTAKQK